MLKLFIKRPIGNKPQTDKTPRLITWRDWLWLLMGYAVLIISAVLWVVFMLFLVRIIVS